MSREIRNCEHGINIGYGCSKCEAMEDELAPLDEANARIADLERQLAALPLRERTGWVVKNGSDSMYRGWAALGPTWVRDPAEATYFARREDAESVHAEDEDAWSVVEMPLPPLLPDPER